MKGKLGRVVGACCPLLTVEPHHSSRGVLGHCLHLLMVAAGACGCLSAGCGLLMVLMDARCHVLMVVVGTCFVDGAAGPWAPFIDGGSGHLSMVVGAG